MGKELETWRSLRRRRANELVEEESNTESSLLALRQELQGLEERIKEKRGQIRYYKAAILKNDSQVERLLANVVAPR